MRISNHKSDRHCTSIDIIDRGNFTYKIIEKYPCDTLEELEAREAYYIRNNECINKKTPGRTREEYRKENKDKIAAYSSTKITCECGCEVTRAHLAEHRRSKKHADLLGHQSLGNN